MAKNEESKISSSLLSLKRQNLQLEGDIVARNQELQQLSDRYSDIQRKLNESQLALEAKQRRSEQVDARIQFLEGGVTPLETRQAELGQAISDLERTRDELESNNATLDSRYLSRKDQVELEIKGLLDKQRELEVAQANMHRQYDQMSEDIAVRAKVLDERESILKRREYKVAQDERMVARNAGLLQL